MKQWPDNNGTVPFHEIVDEFERLVRETYRLRRRGRKVPVYRGYERMHAGLSALPVQETLASNEHPMLARILESLAGVAMEQGRRLGYKEGRAEAVVEMLRERDNEA